MVTALIASKGVLHIKRVVLILATAAVIQGSTTATTVTLNGSYYVLQADGTLSSTTVTSISLDNGEGAILVDPSEGGPSKPAIAGATMIAAPIPSSAAAAMPPTRSLSSSSVSPSSAGSTPGQLLVTDFLDGLFFGLFLQNTPGASPTLLTQLADPFAPLANLDRFFSLWMAGKLLHTPANSSAYDGPLWSADDAIAALFSVSASDDPLDPSSAS